VEPHVASPTFLLASTLVVPLAPIYIPPAPFLVGIESNPGPKFLKSPTPDTSTDTDYSSASDDEEFSGYRVPDIVAGGSREVPFTCILEAVTILCDHLTFFSDVITSQIDRSEHHSALLPARGAHMFFARSIAQATASIQVLVASARRSDGTRQYRYRRLEPRHLSFSQFQHHSPHGRCPISVEFPPPTCQYVSSDRSPFHFRPRLGTRQFGQYIYALAPCCSSTPTGR
jgi:hypothetical protein